MDAKTHIAMANGPPIDGHCDYEHDSDRNERRKSDWLRAGARIARNLARALGLPRGSFDVRINPGGPAVGGDVILHGERLYVSLSQTALGPDFGFMWRTCRGRKDFAGGPNRWSAWDDLLDLPRLAERMRAEMDRSRTCEARPRDGAVSTRRAT
jgi:hypothetical protein